MKKSLAIFMYKKRKTDITRHIYIYIYIYILNESNELVSKCWLVDKYLMCHLPSEQFPISNSPLFDMIFVMLVGLLGFMAYQPLYVI